MFDGKRFPIEWLGLAATTIYLLGVGRIIWANWGSFSKLEPNAWGDFIAGTFGPLALGWLVLGFFLQSRELRLSVEALELQAKELSNSVKQQRELVAVTTDSVIQAQEERKRLVEESHRKASPILDIFAHTNGYGNGVAHYDLTISNSGQPAQNLQLEFRPPLGKLDKRKKSGLTADKPWKLSFTQSVPNRHEISEISATYENTLGRQISVRFIPTRQISPTYENQFERIEE